MRAAFDTLDASRVVIGPASDGGYYLIGMRAPGVPLFEEVEWGTNRVLAQTEALAHVQGLDIARLSEQHDVDTIEEFVHWQQQVLCFTRDDRGQLESVVEDER